MELNQYRNAQKQEFLGVTYGAFIFFIIAVLLSYYNVHLNTRTVVCLQCQYISARAYIKYTIQILYMKGVFTFDLQSCDKKVKQSHYRPGQALRVLGV